MNHSVVTKNYNNNNNNNNNNNLSCAFYVLLKVGNNRDFSLGFNCRTILFNITQMKAQLLANE